MRRTSSVALVVLLASASCSKSDAQRAAEERAKIEKQIEGSLTLAPYRGLKTLLRSHSTTPPPELVELSKLVDRTLEPPKDTKEAAKLYLEVAVGLFKARSVVNQHDEDTLPTLWANYLQEAQPAPWWDARVEHFGIGVALEVLSLADRSGRAPLPDLVFYELSRAEVQPSWPVYLRAMIHLGRGLAFCDADFHYAAEEELGSYLAAWDQVPASEKEEVAHFNHVKPVEVDEVGRAIGHFVRAWNRIGLGRDKAADEDVEAALKSLEKIGVDNELTQWGWAFLHFRRGRYPEAGKALAKLAASPNLDDATRKEIAASATQLQASGANIPVFSKARAARLLVSALVARGGGLEHIVVTIAGEGRGKKLYQPLAWLDTMKEHGAKSFAGKGLDLLKSKVDEIRK